jgi:hypothetical protein
MIKEFDAEGMKGTINICSRCLSCCAQRPSFLAEQKVNNLYICIFNKLTFRSAREKARKLYWICCNMKDM